MFFLGDLFYTSKSERERFNVHVKSSPSAYTFKSTVRLKNVSGSGTSTVYAGGGKRQGGFGSSIKPSYMCSGAINTTSISEPLFMAAESGLSSFLELVGVGTNTSHYVASAALFVGPLILGRPRVNSSAKLAASWQGKGTYIGVDKWRNINLSEGKYVVGGLPGQSNYYTTLNGLKRSGLNKTKLFEGLQVQKHYEFGFRGEVGIYRVNGNLPAAFGTTYANPQFGSGGLPQIFIPDFSELQLITKIPLK